jgi:hypothetical protein
MPELTKQIVVRGEFTETGHIQVCTVTQILEGGVVISESNHRHVVTPGDDYSKEHETVQAICAAVQTSKVIEAYQAKKTSKNIGSIKNEEAIEP